MTIPSLFAEVAVTALTNRHQVCVKFEGSYACNDPARSTRGNTRYSQYDKRGPQGGTTQPKL